MKKLQAVMPGPATQPVQPTFRDAVAVQALAAGEASPEQQKHALDWILKKACGLGTWAYHTEQRETDIALGRQFVGQQIVGVMRVNVSKLQKAEEPQHAVQ